ncbi:MAG TPA: ABC transporter permease, partial [Gemmatimonadales bacterium]|nr:ABC transporter permease [Gemmatimonadales bacterium]
RLAAELKATPGVTGVTASLVGLIAGNNWGTDVNVQGFPVGPDVDNNSRFNQVSAGYFGMLQIPVLSGREFTDADRQGAARVAIVNETFAKKFNLGKDAVGKFMSMSGPDSLNIQIVGLVKDSKYSDVKDTIPPVFFVPWEQYTDAGSISFYVRTSGSMGNLLHQIPAIMKKLDPGIPVEDLKTMPDQIKDNIFLDRMISMLSACFATLATLLAAIGLYGVLAYTVEQRTREIGVRMALGADAAQVRAMVMRQVGVMLAIGGAVGIFGAIAVGVGAKKLLYGLEGHDPVVFALSCVVLALVAASAGYLPARRASQVDPMHALRYE